MRLISCHIENFGRLHDMDMNFTPGLCVIREDNGWGKTTLATFIKVMLYGFAGDSKRSELENERKRYAPWQKGVYGGTLTFELQDGSQYRVERLFGDKKSGTDSFELYDAKTNLKSTDYSENIGEEIFEIDRESWMRTVFVGQQDCTTDVTSGIHAKIGNISDQTADMGNYEAVQDRLKKELDSLTPSRKTGELNKLETQIAALKVEISAKDAQESTLKQLRDRSQQIQADRQIKQSQLTDLQNKISKLAKIKDAQLSADKYKNMCDEEAAAKAKLDDAVQYFPDGMDVGEGLRKEIEQISSRWSDARARRASLPTKESNRDMMKADLGMTSSDKTDISMRHIITIIGAVIIVLAIVLLIVGYTVPAVIILIAGAVVLGVGIYWSGEKLKKYNEEKAQDEERRRVRHDAIDKVEGDIQSDKQYLKEIEEDVRGLYDRLGIEYAEGFVSDKLADIRDHIISLDGLRANYNEKNSQRVKYESTIDVNSIRNITAEPVNDSIESLNNRCNEIKDSVKELDDIYAGLQRQLRDGAEALEDMEQADSRLTSLSERHDILSHRYEVLSRTKLYLEKAKVTFSGRYMDPIRESYEKYYHMISDDDMEYELDANLNLQLKSHGTVHDIMLLSEGYKDMVGLCRRMAMIDAMYMKAKPMLILDDPFANLDDKKLTGAMDFLKQIADEYQIIYMVCTKTRV